MTLPQDTTGNLWYKLWSDPFIVEVTEDHRFALVAVEDLELLNDLLDMKEDGFRLVGRTVAKDNYDTLRSASKLLGSLGPSEALQMARCIAIT